MAKQVRRLNKRFVTFLTIGIMVVMTAAIAILIMATAHKDPKIYGDLGDANMKSGDYKEAIRNYSKAYRYDNKNPSWLLKLSEANYQKGDIKNALGSLQNALTANSNMVEARERLVQMYWDIYGRFAPAALAKMMEEEADKLIKMIPETSVENKPELKKALALGYHVRGVGESMRIAEDPSLEARAKSDLEKAISLDNKAEYVQSLAAMSLEKAQQMVRLAAGETITPDAFDEYIRKMYTNIADAEKLYLQLAKASSADSEAFLKLGDFYFQIWGRVEQAIGMFCESRASGIQNTLQNIQSEITKTSESKEGTAENRRRTIQRLRSSMVDMQSQIPAWKQRSKDHEAKTKQCYDQALKYYKQSLALAKDKDAKVDAEVSLANYYLVQKQIKDAEGLIRQAISDDPDGYTAYRLFASLMRQKTATAKGEEGKTYTDEAIRMLERRVNEGPKVFDGLQGRKNRALHVDLSTVLVELYLGRQDKGDLSKADELLKAIEPDLSNYPVYNQLKASRAIADKDYTTAIIQLEKADKLSDEKNPTVKMMLADLYFRTGNLGAAKSAATAGLGLQPGVYNGIRLLMQIELGLGENEEALRLANQILSMPTRGTDKAALGTKLECLARLNRLEEADQVAKILEKEGTELDWPIQKSRLLLRQGKVSEAEELLEGVLAKSPGEKAASTYLLELYLRQDKLDKANAVLEAAKAKNPDDANLKQLESLLTITDSKERLAKMQEISQKMVDEAMSQQLTKAEEEKDPFRKAMLLYEQYMRRNDLEKAKQYLDEAVKLDAKKANEMNFRYALMTKDWKRAQSCFDLARTNNLDSLKGLSYESELANARGWDLINAKKLEEAKKYFDQSAKAAEEIIKQMPNDSQARALLGEAYWWLDRQNEAGIQITKAMELNSRNPYALRGACLVSWDAVSSGQLNDSGVVRQFAENLQNAYQQMPWDSWLKDRMEWLQSTIAKQREYLADEKDPAADVVARREKIRKTNPQDVDNLIRLATVYENRKEVRDLNKAESCYEEALKAQPSLDLVRLYTAFAKRNNRMPKAEAFMKGMAASDAKAGKGNGYTLLAYHYLIDQNQIEAEKAFTEAVKVEDTAAKRMDMVTFYNQVNNPEKTAEWARKTLDAKPDRRQDRAVRSMLINALLSLQRWDEVAKDITEFKKLYPETPQGLLFEAQMALGQGKMSEADGILTQLLASSPDYVDALNMRSFVYQYTWQLEKAQADLEKLRDINPQGFSVGNQIRLIKLYCEMGKTSEVDRLTRAIIESTKGQSGEALEVIRRELMPALSSSLSERAYESLLIWASNVNQGYWGWIFDRGQYYMLHQRYADASQTFAQLLKTIDKASDGLKLLVLNAYLESLYKAKSYNALLTTAKQASAEFKGSDSRIMGWESMAYYANGEPVKGLAIFEKILTEEKSAPAVWQLTRDIILKSANPRELISSLEKSKIANSSNGRLAIACAYAAADDLTRSEAIYRELANGAKETDAKVVYLYLLGSQLTEKRKYPEAAKVFEEALTLQPDNIAIANNLAYLLEEYLGKPDEALKVIGAMYMNAPNNSDVLDTYGQIMLKLGRLEEALYYTVKSVLINETATSRYHLAMVLLAQNRRTDAAIQFQRSLQLVGEDKILEKQIRDAMKKI